MRKRIGSFTKNRYTQTVRNIMNDLSRPIEVFKKPTKHECFNCHYDKLTNSSTNICKVTSAEAFQLQSDYENSGGIGLRYKYFSSGRCPVCKGKGYLESQIKARVRCKITWDPESEGALVSDSPGVSGSTSVELKTDPKYLKLFTECMFIVVDGVKCVLSKPPILRGVGETALLIILAFTTEKISPPLE